MVAYFLNCSLFCCFVTGNVAKSAGDNSRVDSVGILRPFPTPTHIGKPLSCVLNNNVLQYYERTVGSIEFVVLFHLTLQPPDYHQEQLSGLG